MFLAIQRLLQRLRVFRTDSDIADEVASHYDALVEEATASGLDAAEARRRARLKLGSSFSVVDRVREAEFAATLESWWRDFQWGVRSLWRNPLFSLTAIFTLTIGIGANTVVFTLLYGLLLRSLPVKHPQELAVIGIDSPPSRPLAIRPLPYQMFEDLRRRQTSFARLSAWIPRNLSIEAGEATPLLVFASFADGQAFDLLGLVASPGRLLTAADDVPGGPPTGWTAVLDHSFWLKQFGGDPDILGRQIKLNGNTVTIVGVAPRDFHGIWPGLHSKIYVPLHFAAALDNRPDLSMYFCRVVGRLQPGRTIVQAQAELSTYQRDLFDTHFSAEVRQRQWYKTASFKVDSARTGLPTLFSDAYEKPLYLMQGLVGIVLLLCCVNVAGLMLSQLHARRQEFSIRTALGAARWRLIRQYLTESLVIALIGASLAAVVAWYGTGALLPYFRHPNEGIGLQIQPDRAVFLVTGVLAFLTTLLFGTVPAWRAGAADPGILLKARTSGSLRRRFFSRTFIPIQVALSFALVSLAALLTQSLTRLQTESTGFELDRVTIQTAPLHLLKLPAEAQLELYRKFQERIERAPGVESVSYTWLTPMTTFQATAHFQAVSSNVQPREDPHMPFNEVGPGYFHTMRTVILAGREFQHTDRDRSVCILNQSAAAHFFPGQEPLGQFVRTVGSTYPGHVTCRVVGIAQDAKFANLNEPPPRTLYFPANPATLRNSGNMVFLINAATKAHAIDAYKAARAEISPSTPFVLFVTLREQMDAALGSNRALSLMSSFFAGLALFLSGLGLYALLSSSVIQRTSEIGLRMALGAERGSVLCMILLDAMSMLLAGIMLGAMVLFVMAPFVQRMLYGVTVFEPARIAAIVGLLAVVAIGSALLPALRAASVDPIRALRVE